MPTPTQIDRGLTGNEVIDLIRRLSSTPCYLSLADAAARVSTTKKQMLRWIHDGELRAYAPLPGKWLVQDRELNDFVLRHQVKTA